MESFKNLAPKIRSLRKKLGKKQEDLAEDLGVSRSLVALWESNLLKNRVTPSGEKLIALSKLTKQPWHTMCWLMDDEIDSSTGVEYFPDGSKVVEPKFSDEDIQGFMAEDLARQNEPPSGEIEKLINDPDNVFKLRQLLSQSALRKRTTAESEKTTAAAQSSGLIVRALPTIWSIAGIESKKPSNRFFVQPEGMTYDDYLHYIEIEEKDRWDNFRGGLKYYLNSEQQIENANSFFEHVAEGGAIKARVDYFDTKNVFGFIVAEPSKEVGAIRRALTSQLSKLFLFEKIKGKTYRKKIIIYTIEDLYNEFKLKEVFLDLINSAGALGVSVDVCCGPQKVAESMSRLIKS